jgi:hypothetical protein
MLQRGHCSLATAIDFEQTVEENSEKGFSMNIRQTIDGVVKKISLPPDIAKILGKGLRRVIN